MYRKTALILIGILSFWATTAQTTAKEWYENGLKLFDAKKYSEAVISFDKAAGLNPQYDAAWYRAGWCYNDLEQYSKALERLKKAVEVNKRYHQAYQEMGYAYRKLNMYEQALSSLNSAIAIRSDYAMAYKQKGDVYKEMNKSTEAIETYKRCLEYDSQNESVLFNIGYLYNGLADYDNAIVWLRKATAVKQTAATYNEIGFAYYKQKINDSAIANYRNALRIAPNNGTAYKGIGDVYRRNYSPARTDDAMESYKKAIQHNPNSAGSHFGLGWCYNEKGNYTESVPYLQKALSLDNGMVAAYTEMGYAQYMTGKNYEAIETFKKGVGIDAKNTLCRYYAGLVYLKLKDKTKAIDMCNGLRPLDGQLADKLLAKINAL